MMTQAGATEDDATMTMMAVVTAITAAVAHPGAGATS
jgi:hypothetical protein